MLEPIKAEKLYNIIVRRISAFIDEQKLKPGDRLPSERELAAALSVSRASVRQAIAVLSAQGILVMRQGDGTFVADYINDEQSLEIFSRYLARSQLDPDDILEARLIIECEAARLCAARANKEHITNIQNILDKKDYAQLKQRAGDKQAENVNLNRELHLAIARGTQNMVLPQMIELLWKIMSNNMWPLIKKESVLRHDSLNQHKMHHEQIVKMITQHDAEGAYKAMYDHLMSIKEGVDDIVESGGVE